MSGMVYIADRKAEREKERKKFSQIFSTLFQWKVLRICSNIHGGVVNQKFLFLGFVSCNHRDNKSNFFAVTTCGLLLLVVIVSLTILINSSSVRTEKNSNENKS